MMNKVWTKCQSRNEAAAKVGPVDTGLVPQSFSTAPQAPLAFLKRRSLRPPCSSQSVLHLCASVRSMCKAITFAHPSSLKHGSSMSHLDFNLMPLPSPSAQSVSLAIISGVFHSATRTDWLRSGPLSSIATQTLVTFNAYESHEKHM